MISPLSSPTALMISSAFFPVQVVATDLAAAAAHVRIDGLVMFFPEKKKNNVSIVSGSETDA